MLHGSLHIRSHRHQIRLRLLVDGDAQRVLAVQPVLVGLLLRHVRHLRDVGQCETSAHREIQNVLQVGEPAQWSDLRLQPGLLDAARGQVEVLVRQPALHVEDVEAVGLQAGRVKGDAHVELIGAEQLHRVHPGDAFEDHAYACVKEPPGILLVEIGRRNHERQDRFVAVVLATQLDVADVVRQPVADALDQFLGLDGLGGHVLAFFQRDSHPDAAGAGVGEHAVDAADGG